MHKLFTPQIFGVFFTSDKQYQTNQSFSPKANILVLLLPSDDITLIHNTGCCEQYVRYSLSLDISRIGIDRQVRTAPSVLSVVTFDGNHYFSTCWLESEVESAWHAQQIMAPKQTLPPPDWVFLSFWSCRESYIKFWYRKYLIMSSDCTQLVRAVWWTV